MSSAMKLELKSSRLFISPVFIFETLIVNLIEELIYFVIFKHLNISIESIRSLIEFSFNDGDLDLIG
eukprot:CAMPEP_0176442148 /NCGR_PEP_ID=MMETSP0127-20121128/21632_1 /TAXON_ID=938130 /ORGANISM="Platyophrya macrostoma, Strain WH" /LENGTH=66 /DNA_ID=CAMNT_0017827085 /DNA_START=187 /DNA_END=383 /DNA_ORIENTATION=-